MDVRRTERVRHWHQIVEPGQANQSVERNCRDQAVVAFLPPVIKRNAPGCGIDLRCRTTEIEMSPADRLGHAPPYGAGSALLRIAELGIWSPILIVALVEQVG